MESINRARLVETARPYGSIVAEAEAAAQGLTELLRVNHLHDKVGDECRPAPVVLRGFDPGRKRDARRSDLACDVRRRLELDPDALAGLPERPFAADTDRLEQRLASTASCPNAAASWPDATRFFRSALPSTTSESPSGIVRIVSLK
jgi:hypothetical protein